MGSSLWFGHLRVDPVLGAGLMLTPCEIGFLVKDIELKPGQPDLRVGDVILAMGGNQLLALEDEEVERRFGEAYCNGATFVAGHHSELSKKPFGEVVRELKLILSVTKG